MGKQKGYLFSSFVISFLYPLLPLVATHLLFILLFITHTPTLSIFINTPTLTHRILVKSFSLIHRDTSNFQLESSIYKSREGFSIFSLYPNGECVWLRELLGTPLSFLEQTTRQTRLNVHIRIFQILNTHFSTRSTRFWLNFPHLKSTNDMLDLLGFLHFSHHFWYKCAPRHLWILWSAIICLGPTPLLPIYLTHTPYTTYSHVVQLYKQIAYTNC